MILIKPDRCGYTGYICNNIPKLNDIFNTTELVGDPIIDNTDFDKGLSVERDTQGNVVSITHPIDNYLNLPVKVAGFVSSVPLIYSLDFLKSTADGCSLGILVDAAAKMDKITAWIGTDYTNTTDIKNDSLLIYDKDSSGENKEASPGMLDVMANPLPDNIDIDGMPDFDMALDGIIFAIYNMLKWQDLTNARLSALEQKKYKNQTSNVIALKNMLLLANKATTCDNFKIEWKKGPIITSRNSGEKTTYTVNDGTVIYSDGTEIYVEGTEFDAPFDISLYIMRDPDDDSKLIGEISFSGLVQAGLSNILAEHYIGAVKEIDTRDELSKDSGFDKTVNTKYKMYQIVQAECLLYVGQDQQFSMTYCP